MAKTLVNQSATTTVTLPTTGNYLLLIGINATGSAMTAPSGVAGTWSVLFSQVTAAAKCAVVLYLGVGPFSGTTITLGTNMSKSSTTEWSGFTGRPTVISSNSNSSTANSLTADAGSVTTDAGDRLVFAGNQVGGSGGNTATGTLGTMNALTVFNIGTSNLGRGAYLNTNAIATYDPTWLYNSGAANCSWAAFITVIGDPPNLRPSPSKSNVAIQRASIR